MVLSPTSTVAQKNKCIYFSMVLSPTQISLSLSLSQLRHAVAVVGHTVARKQGHFILACCTHVKHLTQLGHFCTTLLGHKNKRNQIPFHKTKRAFML